MGIGRKFTGGGAIDLAPTQLRQSPRGHGRKESKSDPAEHSCYSNKQVCGGVGMRGTVFPHLLALVTLLEAPGAA